MITLKDLEELEEYLASGRLADEFIVAEEDRKHEILEILEKLMDVADLADQTATKLIFPGSYMEMLSGVKAQK